MNDFSEHRDENGKLVRREDSEKAIRDKFKQMQAEKGEFQFKDKDFVFTDDSLTAKLLWEKLYQAMEGKK